MTAKVECVVAEIKNYRAVVIHRIGDEKNKRTEYKTLIAICLSKRQHWWERVE